MRFNRQDLSLTARPDPLWLHKVGTSLIYDEASKRARESGQTIGHETAVILAEIKNCIEHPDQISHTQTALEPLIDKVAGEALALNRIFDFFFHHDQMLPRDAAKSVGYLKDRIAKEILSIYSNTSALVHLEHTSQISEEELQIGAALEVQKLNRYGTNGLTALSHVWPNRDLLTELQQSTKKFVPSWLGNYFNTSKESISRKDYLEKELEKAKPASEEAKAKFLEEMTPTLLGHEYKAAWEAKESFLLSHIKSGIRKVDPFWIKILALHRDYERAQKHAVTYETTPAFEYFSPALALEEKWFKERSAASRPDSFFQTLDTTFSRLHPDQSKIANDLRAAIAELKGQQTLPIESPLEQSAHQSEAEIASSEVHEATTGASEAKRLLGHEHVANDMESLASTVHSKNALAIKGGVALLGGIVIADQFRRTHKKDADQSNEQKVSKITNYIIATAAAVGTGLVIFTKPEKLIRFADNVFEFLGKSTSRG